MIEDHEQPGSNELSEGEVTLPPLRRDIQEGLRRMHEMIAATQEESLHAAADVRALAMILVEAGIIQPYELEEILRQARWQMARELMPRVRLGSVRDKYTAAGSVDIDCPSLIPICQGRCCAFVFCLTKQDLDEGVVRWDYGNPYWIKQGADGRCTHSDPVTHLCTIHEHRPFNCRKFDCRNDERIWDDFEKKILAPPLAAPGDDPVAMAELLLHLPPQRMDREDA